MTTVSRDTVFGVMTSLRAVRLRSGGSLPGRGKRFVTSSNCSAKRLGYEADFSLPSSVEFKKDGGSTFILPCVLWRAQGQIYIIS